MPLNVTVKDKPYTLVEQYQMVEGTPLLIAYTCQLDEWITATIQPPASIMTDRHIWRCLGKAGQANSLEGCLAAAVEVQKDAWERQADGRMATS